MPACMRASDAPLCLLHPPATQPLAILLLHIPCASMPLKTSSLKKTSSRLLLCADSPAAQLYAGYSKYILAFDVGRPGRDSRRIPCVVKGPGDYSAKLPGRWLVGDADSIADTSCQVGHDDKIMHACRSFPAHTGIPRLKPARHTVLRRHGLLPIL
jgi:hypothetical protein